jgi:hypothetical protein
MGARPPGSAEELYALAIAAPSADHVTGLIKHAESRGWSHEYVVTDPAGGGVADALCDALDAVRQGMAGDGR